MKKFPKLFIAILAVSISLLPFSAISFGDEYVIKPNDNLRTYVFDNPDLSVNTDVPPDGIISFPLVGEVNVLGMTTNQLAKLLEDKIKYYLMEPKVSVFVTVYNPLKVYILGALRTPGAYDYKPGSRLTDYLTEAGGFYDNANLKECYIYPLDKDKPRIKLNLKELLEKPESELDIELHPFDTVYLKEKSGFLFTEWRDVADAMSIILGIATLYIVISRY